MTENHASRAAPPGDVSTANLRRVSASGAIGQFVEWYDYGIYGFLAAPIAANFFPGGSAAAGLLETFAVFAVTFVVRPFGGVLCGYLADRIGRRRVLVGVLLIISLATALVGILPGYGTVGVAAPILLVGIRLIQGLSAGGEVVSSMSFVGEHAPDHRRAFLMCWAQAGSFVSLLLGNVIGLMLNAWLTTEQLNAWAWRLPFLLALPLAAIGFYVRRKLSESPAFQAMTEAGETPPSPLRESLASPRIRRAILVCGALALLNSSGYYALCTYMPTYLSTTLHYSPGTAFAATAVAVVALLIAVPPMAIVSDRVGRRPVLIWSSVAMIVVAYPCFWLTRHGLGFAIAGLVVMAVAFGAYTAVIHATLVELFPTRVRVTAYSVGYNISTAIFGGAAPFLLVLLTGVTGDTAMPAYYIIATAIGTLITAVKITETGGTPLVQDTAPEPHAPAVRGQDAHA